MPSPVLYLKKFYVKLGTIWHQLRYFQILAVFFAVLLFLAEYLMLGNKNISKIISKLKLVLNHEALALSHIKLNYIYVEVTAKL